MRKITGEVEEVHMVFISAAATHAKGHFSWLEAGGGYIIPEASQVGKALRLAYEVVMEQYGVKDLIPVWEEKGVYNFYLKGEKEVPWTDGPRPKQRAAALRGEQTPGYGVPKDVSAADRETVSSSSGASATAAASSGSGFTRHATAR